MIKEGDYIVRVWPSGRLTMGIAVIPSFQKGVLYFQSIETYDSEGGVVKGDTYGQLDSNHYIQRLATPIEIEAFENDGNLKDLKKYYRDKKIERILE